MHYRTVPFHEAWITHEKLDVKAIYRRPHRQGPLNEIAQDASGQPLWDFSALPVRRHNDWLAKGFEYVTLADAEALAAVAPHLRAAGLEPRDFIMDPRTNSPWHPGRYAEQSQQAVADEHERLAAMVALHGPDTVEQIMRASHPGFVLPAALRTPAPAGTAAPAAAAPAAAVPRPAPPTAAATPSMTRGARGKRARRAAKAAAAKAPAAKAAVAPPASEGAELVGGFKA